MTSLIACISALAAFGFVLQSPDILLGRLLGNRKFHEAREYVAENYRSGLDGAPAALLAQMEGAAADEAGNVIGYRKGQREDSVVAVVAGRASASSVATLSALIEALNASGITTKSSLAFVLLESGDGLEFFLQNSAYGGRVVSCVLIGAVEEGKVLAAPNSIGSTVVQYGLQSISAFGLEPEYEGEMGDLAAPIKMKIPAIELGSRKDEASARSIQIVMTAVLAIAGI